MELARRKRLLTLLESAEAIIHDEDEKSDRECPGKIPLQIEIR